MNKTNKTKQNKKEKKTKIKPISMVMKLYKHNAFIPLLPIFNNQKQTPNWEIFKVPSFLNNYNQNTLKEIQSP